MQITVRVVHRHGPGGCAMCPTRSSCRELCSEAETWVNQDCVEQKEYTNSICGNEVVNFSELQVLTPSRDEEILRLFFVNHNGVRKIARILGIDAAYVSRRLKKYKAIMLKNLKK